MVPHGGGGDRAPGVSLPRSGRRQALPTQNPNFQITGEVRSRAAKGEPAINSATPKRACDNQTGLWRHSPLLLTTSSTMRNTGVNAARRCVRFSEEIKDAGAK